MAQQCGISEELVNGIYLCYIALSSKLPICPKKFKLFCQNLRFLYERDLPWCFMPVSMHKVVEHSPEYLALIPPSITSGMLSEEGSESANKFLKAWQIDHARQNSIINRNLDVFHRQTEISDPKILSYFEDKKKKRQNHEPFPREIIDLCKNPDEILGLHGLQ